MIDLVYCLINLLVFGIPLLYYYINFKSLIIYSLFSADIHFFCCWYFSNKSCIFCFTFNCIWTVFSWTFCNFCNFIKNFITNQITSWFCCLNLSFWSIFKCICSRLFSMISKFLTIFTVKSLHFPHISSKR